MKINLTAADLTKPTRPRSARRLPGERHDFVEMRKPIPPQYLAPDGAITSSRDHEVGRTDPLLARIRELEAEVARLTAERNHLRARLDAVLLEFDPKELTQEELQEWIAAQVISKG